MSPADERALQSFYTRIDGNQQLTKDFKRHFEELCVPQVLAKGELICTQGQELQTIVLGLSGLFRTFDPEHNLTMGLIRPLSFLPPVGLLKAHAPLPVSVEALMASRVLKLSYPAFQALTETDFRWYRILWNLAQEEATDREALRVSMLIDPAPLRYKKFLEEYGPFERHIRIGHVASYLGMTPATLSRIRSKQWNNLLD
jgi:CRP-like cAMP-binding protein